MAAAMASQRSVTVRATAFLRSRLDLGESHLDVVEVGTVGWQEAQLGPGTLDRLAASGL